MPTCGLALALVLQLFFVSAGPDPAALSKADPKGRLQRFESSNPEMGTVFRIVLYASSLQEADAAVKAAFDRVRQLNDRLSDYLESSELRLLSSRAGQGPQAASADLFHILERCDFFYRLSKGAFDPTVAPLVQLWRQARRSRRLPTPEVLHQARLLVGFSRVKLDPLHRTVTLEQPGMLLDLGGIAKGFAADEALRVLREKGIPSALVDAGGDLRLGAPPPGKKGWTVTVEGADSRTGHSSLNVLLCDAALATSGDTRQFLEIDGIRYSHILDPKSGVGLRHSASVSVVAPDGTSADALATAFSVMAPREALELADTLPGVGTRITVREDAQLHTYTSSHWAQRFQVPEKETR